MTMRAIQYEPEAGRFLATECPIPEPGPQEVLVRVRACGLNPVDAKIDRWFSLVPKINSAYNPDTPFIPGLDVQGEILRVGAQVEGWAAGDSVLYHGHMFSAHGGLAEYALNDARTLTKAPAVEPELAAATPCAGWTAMHALRDMLQIQRRQSIFIAGGSGGTGSFAVQIAKDAGVETIIASCSAKNADYVRQLGATHTIDHQAEDVLARVLEITGGEGVECAMDAVGGDNDILCASALCFEGAMVELVRTVRPASYPDAFDKALSFFQISLGSGHRYGARGRLSITEAGRSVSRLLELGRVTCPSLRVIPLEEVPAALAQILEGRTVGKVVCSLSA